MENTSYDVAVEQRKDMRSSFLQEDAIEAANIIECLKSLNEDFSVNTSGSSSSHTNRNVKGSKRFIDGVSTPKHTFPVRKSLRLQNITPDGAQLPYTEKAKTLQEEQEEAKKLQSPKRGPLKMTEVCYRRKLGQKHRTNAKIDEDMGDVDESNKNCDVKQQIEIEEISHLITDAVDSIDPILREFPSFLKDLKCFELKENHIAKVVPNRAFSLTFHPSSVKVILACGDKSGTIGIWNVNSDNSDNEGIYAFNPHVSPINCLQFSSDSSSKLYSCSYDGTVRCGDFEAGVFDELFRMDSSNNLFPKSFCFKDSNTLFVACNDGAVRVIDVRSAGKCQLAYQVHEKSVMSVCCHPTVTNYMATSSADATAKIWDCRKGGGLAKRKGGAGPSLTPIIFTAQHGKIVESVSFSPRSGSKMLTLSKDDTMKLYDTSHISSGTIGLIKKIAHGNQTGRWLTKFRPVWHSGRDDTFVVGSMLRPRRVEVFTGDGCLVHNLTADVEMYNSVCSITAIHPTLHYIAGVNASGRVHMWC